jgi:hypothetical protein
VTRTLRGAACFFLQMSSSTPTGPAAEGSGVARRLSVQLDALLEVIGDEPVTLRRIIRVLKGRAYMVLLIILALPFAPPLPLPGLSTVFGVVIALLGLRLALRQEPWLPARLLDAPMKPQTARRLLSTTRRLALLLEKLVRPRWSFLVDPPVFQHLYGAMICLCGLLLSLPLPIPFVNMLPAITVVLLASALIERDGYFAIAGMSLFAVVLCFFGAIFLGGATVVNWLEQRFGGSGYDPLEEPPAALEEIIR